MMKSLQKMGGFAALYEAVAYLVGIAFFLFAMDYPGIVEPAQKVALLVDNQVSMYLTTLFMYVVFGVFLVVLVLALYERLKAGAPVLMQVATAFGLIWAGALIASGMVFSAGIAPVVALYGQDPAQAASVWLAIESVANGLGGANGEILGGCWTLLICWAALRTGGLPRALGYLGVVVGGVGIISTIPGLNDLSGVFGMGQIVWFVWLGILMLRRSPNATA
jgi:Domain of unknown function (DUF4386)